MLVVRRPRFVDDLSEAYASLALRSPRAADRMLDQVEALVALLADFPELGPPRSDLREGARYVVLRRFRYLLFYRLTEDRVVLLRFLHGARNIGSSMF